MITGTLLKKLSTKAQLTRTVGFKLENVHLLVNRYPNMPLSPCIFLQHPSQNNDFDRVIMMTHQMLLPLLDNFVPWTTEASLQLSKS